MTNNSGALPSVEDNNELAALWQQQPTLNVNVEEIVNLAKSQRRKQRFYMVLDFLSLLPLVVILFLDLKLSPLLQAFLLANAVAAIIVVSYFTKLRWHSAFGQLKSTTEYINVSLQQLRNNARIANINKHLAWVAAVGGILIVLAQIYLGEDEIGSAFIRISVLIILLLTWTVWAYKREKRFLNEVKALEAKITN